MMDRKRSINKFRNDRSGLTGLALRIFIMVIIAGICLVAIVGYIVMSKPDLDDISYEPILIGGYEGYTIWCNWTESTNASIFKPNPGEHWYAGASLASNHVPNSNLYNAKITII